MDSNALVKASKPKTLLRLKDYLLDDLNSCSSSGFQTYPRLQCCTTVRYLLEIDMKNKLIQNVCPSSSRLSTFQKASEAILTAVKHLGLTMVKSSSSSQDKNTKIATLSKSFSRKLIKKGFWKKIDRKEIISCVEEKSEPLNGSTSDDVNGSRRVGETVGDYRHSMDVTNSSNSGSTTSTGSKKCWTNEEKEQFSPVSVLDCPFDEEDEVCSSPFRHNRLHQDEETKKKLMKKLRKFERLAQLEPVNLENRLVCDQASIQCDQLNSSKTSLINFMLETEEEKPMKLLQLIKDTTSFELKVDDLLLDFFNERLLNGDEQCKANELLSAAKDYINGKYHEFSVDWEVRKNRQAFLRDIEKKGEWKKMYEDIKEIAMELEDEIFSDLVNELMDDLFQ